MIPVSPSGRESVLPPNVCRRKTRVEVQRPASSPTSGALQAWESARCPRREFRDSPFGTRRHRSRCTALRTCRLRIRAMRPGRPERSGCRRLHSRVRVSRTGSQDFPCFEPWRFPPLHPRSCAFQLGVWRSHGDLKCSAACHLRRTLSTSSVANFSAETSIIAMRTIGVPFSWGQRMTCPWAFT